MHRCVAVIGRQAFRIGGVSGASHTHQAAAFATVKAPAKKIRIETKLGVGLRYRRPRVWSGDSVTSKDYAKEDVAGWRKTFGFHSKKESNKEFYTDEELLAWRSQFDANAAGKNTVSFGQFQKMVKDKFKGALEDKAIPSKVISVWNIFDKDHSNDIDFGEFIQCGMQFDMDCLKLHVQTNGIKEVFEEYANDGFLGEEEVFRLMEDKKFFLTSTTDSRKFIKQVDVDGDSLISRTDWDKWVASQ